MSSNFICNIMCIYVQCYVHICTILYDCNFLVVYGNLRMRQFKLHKPYSVYDLIFYYMAFYKLTVNKFL